MIRATFYMGLFTINEFKIDLSIKVVTLVLELVDGYSFC